MRFGNTLPYLLLTLASASSLQPISSKDHFKTCTVQSGGSKSIDDAPAVLEAFHECGHGGRVVFANTTYHINSVMKTTGLEDCQVDLYGTLLVSLPPRYSYRMLIQNSGEPISPTGCTIPFLWDTRTSLLRGYSGAEMSVSTATDTAPWMGMDRSGTTLCSPSPITLAGRTL